MGKTNILSATLAIFSISLLIMSGIAFALEALYYNVEPPRNDVQQLDGVTSSSFGTAHTSKFIGENIQSASPLVGQQINKVGIYMEKVTADQQLFGNIYVGFWNVGAEPTLSNALRIFGSIPANSIVNPSTNHLYNFTLESGNYTIPASSAVGAFYIDPLGTAPNSDGIYISARANVYDGSNTRAICHVNNVTAGGNSCFALSLGVGAVAGQWGADNASDALMILSSEVPDEEDPDIIGGIDCSLPANEFKLICRLGGDGEAETNLGGLVGDGIILLGCNVIFVDCSEDTDPSTNGLGLLVFIASVFVVIGMFYWTMGSNAFNMPFFIWVIIIIALSAFFTIVGIIDPIFLIISIIAIIALCAPRLLKTFGGSTFGGGSTE